MTVIPLGRVDFANGMATWAKAEDDAETKARPRAHARAGSRGMASTVSCLACCRSRIVPTTLLDQRLSERRDRDAARAKVEDALGRIHARYARAIRLRVLEERPRDEVAVTLEVSPATFDVLLHRAIAALKKALEEPATPGK